jgi:hypothetical protein
MSFHRAVLVALATLFTLGMTSLASAGCCNNWGYSAPVNYGCGGCGTPTYAAVYAVPVAPAPIAVSSCCGGGWGGGGWGGGTGWGGCGCGGAGFASASQFYVVNQGPQFSGPGLMLPYGTYAPETAYAPATDYPYGPAPAYGAGYDPGYSYGPPAYRPYYTHRYYRPRYAYRGPMYGRPHYYGPGPRYFRPGPHYRHYPY